jgi:hypothetical protein
MTLNQLSVGQNKAALAELVSSRLWRSVPASADRGGVSGVLRDTAVSRAVGATWLRSLRSCLAAGRWHGVLGETSER